VEWHQRIDFTDFASSILTSPFSLPWKKKCHWRHRQHHPGSIVAEGTQLPAQKHQQKMAELAVTGKRQPGVDEAFGFLKQIEEFEEEKEHKKGRCRTKYCLPQQMKLCSAFLSQVSARPH
jgi:hypothetical protein